MLLGLGRDDYWDYNLLVLCEECGGMCSYGFNDWTRDKRESESVFVMKQVLENNEVRWRKCCNCSGIYAYCKYCCRRKRGRKQKC